MQATSQLLFLIAFNFSLLTISCGQNAQESQNNSYSGRAAEPTTSSSGATSPSKYPPTNSEISKTSSPNTSDVTASTIRRRDDLETKQDLPSSSANVRDLFGSIRPAFSGIASSIGSTIRGITGVFKQKTQPNATDCPLWLTNASSPDTCDSNSDETTTSSSHDPLW